MKLFWYNVKIELINQNRTQIELAKYCGLSVGTLRNKMNLQVLPTFEVAIKIADFLKVTLDYLLKGKAAEIAPTIPTAETKANSNDLVNQNLTQKLDLQQEFEIFYKDMFYTLLNVMAHKDIIKQEWKRNRNRS